MEVVDPTSPEHIVLAPATENAIPRALPAPEDQHPTVEELRRPPAALPAPGDQRPTVEELRRAVPRFPHWRRELGLAAAGLGVVVAVVAAMVLSGAALELEQLLEADGFDLERAWLLTALATVGASAFAAGLVTGQRRWPALLGVIGLFAVFGGTFASETQNAANIRNGLDPAGWVLTLVTLVVSGIVAAWAAATLGAEVRNSFAATWHRTGALWEERGPLGLANRRIAATIAVVLVVAISTTALSDMINYSPDTRFRTGRGGISLLGGGNPTPSPAPGVSGAPGTPGLSGGSPAPTVALGPTASADGTPAPTDLAGPAAPGTVEDTQLPAPWTGGARTTLTASVYLPDGYASSGTTKYPVVYLVPMPFTAWQQGAHVQELLDTLIGSGQIPPMIVVFLGGPGGPYPASECADSVDGQEHMETFLSTTLPEWVDSHYRTIADAPHRTIGGYSNGGFCASMLLLAHPDVFRQAIVFGGYYTAGIESPQTVNAWKPWNHDQAVIDAHSPVKMAGALPADVRSKLFLFVTGTPTAIFFGQQYTDFETALETAGIAHQFMDIPAAHSWPTVQAALPAALKAAADRIASGAGT